MKEKSGIINENLDGIVEMQNTDMSMTQSADRNSICQGGDDKTDQTIQDSNMEPEQTREACPESKVKIQETDTSMTQSSDRNSISQDSDDKTDQTVQDSDMESEQTREACPESKQSETHTCRNRVSELFELLKDPYYEFSSDNCTCPRTPPTYSPYNNQSPKPIVKSYNAASISDLTNDDGCPQWRICQPFWIVLASIIIFVLLLLLPMKCYAQSQETSQDSVQAYSCMLLASKDNKSNGDFWTIVSSNRDSSIYIQKSVEDFVTHVDLKKDTVMTTAYREIDYVNRSWYIYLYRIIIALLLAVTLVIMFKYLIPYWTRLIEIKQKFDEEKYRDQRRFMDEDREFERLQNKTELAIYEKLEKTKIDEWIRDNEHNRNMERREHERLSNLSAILVELAKIKNTITIEQCGKKVTIERSILSCDCCEELKDIVQTVMLKDDCCCKKVKDLLKYLFFTDGKLDCEKLKTLFKDDRCCEKVKVILINLTNKQSNHENSYDVLNDDCCCEKVKDFLKSLLFTKGEFDCKKLKDVLRVLICSERKNT